MSGTARRPVYVVVGLLLAAILGFLVPTRLLSQSDLAWPINAPDGGAIRTRNVSGATLVLQGYNTTTSAPTSLVTITAGTTPTLTLATSAYIGTTAVALNRSSAALSVADLSVTGTGTWNAGSVTSSAGISGTTLAGTDDSTVTKTVTSATPATERLFYSKVTLTPATTMAIGSGGSIAGIRGETNFTTGKTFTEGFLYGAQGKSVFAGTLNEGSAARVTGVLGQTDVTGATLTAGQVSGVWADLQGNATNTQTFPLRVTNSMSSDARALGFFYGTETYLFEVNDAATAKFVETTAGTGAGECAQTGGLVATKALKITANGTDYWIPLCTAK